MFSISELGALTNKKFALPWKSLNADLHTVTVRVCEVADLPVVVVVKDLGNVFVSDFAHAKVNECVFDYVLVIR